MICGDINLIIRATNGRDVVCRRPDDHTRFHKGQGFVWCYHSDERVYSRWTTKTCQLDIMDRP